MFPNNNFDVDSNEFSARLREVIGSDSISQFARKCGIGESSLRPYLKGAFPRMDKLVVMARAAGVNLEWLATGEGPKHPTENDSQKGNQATKNGKKNGLSSQEERKYASSKIDGPTPDMFAYVPLVSVYLSAGDGCFVYSEDVVGYYAFRRDWLRRTTSGIANVVLVIVTGRSMIPTLREKDFVMVDTGQTRIVDDLIYAIRIDDTVMVKRLRQRPGEIIKVVSDNRDEYEAYETAREDVHVIGQVVWSCRSYLTGV